MFCKNCGAEIDDNAVICVNCGVATGTGVTEQADSGNAGWGVLGCCIPLVGFILYLVWKDSKPKNAKMAGIGALVSFGFGLLYYLFIFMAGVASF